MAEVRHSGCKECVDRVHLGSGSKLQPPAVPTRPEHHLHTGHSIATVTAKLS